MFGEAFLDADAGALEHLLTEEYLHIIGTTGSIFKKPEWLAYVRTRREELHSKKLMIEKVSLSRLAIAKMIQ